MSEWTSVKDKLPENNQYVLAIHNRGTWRDSDDPVKVNYVVLKFVRGTTTGQGQNDMQGNNLVPYGWNSFGPDHFFGQSVDYWMPLPEYPK